MLNFLVRFSYELCCPCSYLVCIISYDFRESWLYTYVFVFANLVFVLWVICPWMRHIFYGLTIAFTFEALLLSRGFSLSILVFVIYVRLFSMIMFLSCCNMLYLQSILSFLIVKGVLNLLFLLFDLVLLKSGDFIYLVERF